jgi:hypothetical protein
MYFDGDFPAWRDDIVALYFGVRVEKSRQVLLESPLREAIDSAEVGQFKNLMRYPGAFKVFDDVLRTYPYDPADANSQDFAFKAAAMLETVQGQPEAVKRAWKYLVDKIVESVPAPALADFDRKLAPFLRSVSRGQRARIIPTATRWLSSLASTVNDEQSFALIARSYETLKRQESEVPKIVLRGETAGIINAIYWINGNEALERFVSVEPEFSKLVPDLANLVNDDADADIVPEVLAFQRRLPSAFPAEKTYTLAPVRDACLAVMEGAYNASLTKYAARTLGLMAALTGKSKEVVDAMIDAGHLQARMNEAINADDQETVGVLAALAIARGKPFSADAGEPGDRQRLQAMETALGEFVSNPLNSLWNAQAAGSSPAFMSEALEYVARERDFTVEEFDQISGNLDFYFEPLNTNTRHALARKIGANPRQVEKIGRASPSSILIDVFTPWLRFGVPDAQKQCKTAVENVPIESWKSFLESESDWALKLLEKCPNDFKLALNSNAVQGAISLIDERSASLNISQRARLRKLISHFNTHAQRKIIDTIVAHIPSHTEDAFGLIKALSEETSASISGHFTSDTLIKLLGGLSTRSAGRAWLQTQTDAIQNAISRFDRRSKREVREWFRGAVIEKPKARADWVEMMGHRLGFDR